MSIPKVTFGKTEDAYDGFEQFLKDIIAKNHCKKVLDVGGGAQPMLSCAYNKSAGIDYTVLDISEEELANASPEYRKIVGDVSAKGAVFGNKYDLIFSRFVIEHVKDAEQLHRNLFGALKPGGMAVHLFPTLFAAPFLVNRLLPEWMAMFFLPEARRKKGKFAAYYTWCFGPNRKGIERFRSIGYEVVEYSGFFGHGYYDAFPVLRAMHGMVRRILLRFPMAFATSFAWVVLRKPESAENSFEEQGLTATLLT